jgi:hypothetical protein
MAAGLRNMALTTTNIEHLSAEKKKGRMRFQDLFTSENTSKWMLYLVYLFINLAFFRMIKY